MSMLWGNRLILQGTTVDQGKSETSLQTTLSGKVTKYFPLTDVTVPCQNKFALWESRTHHTLTPSLKIVDN